MKGKLNENFQNLLEKKGVLDKDGNVVGTSVEDVVEVANSMLQLRDGQFNEIKLELEKMKIIMDTTPCTVSWVHKDLTYGGVNKTLADICGMERDVFSGKTIGFYTENKYFYNFTQMLFKRNETTLYDEITTNIGDDETSFWVVGTKFDSGDQAVVIGIDITELRALEKNVTFMEKLSSLGEMVASIVHEVNNPLTLINAQAHRIKKQVAKHDEEKILETVEKIESTTEKISQIIRGVKSFVRQGTEDPKVEVNLYDTIQDARSIVEGKLKENNVNLEISEANKDVMIKANVTQIFQVFVNLITNGIDAVEDKDDKWIKIEIENNDGVQVRVTDCGDGIPQAVQDQIFKSFFTTKALGKGTGLGLSLCKKIMVDHEGDLEVDNDHSNTSFMVKFAA